MESLTSLFSLLFSPYTLHPIFTILHPSQSRNFGSLICLQTL